MRSHFIVHYLLYFILLINNLGEIRAVILFHFYVHWLTSFFTYTSTKKGYV